MKLEKQWFNLLETEIKSPYIQDLKIFLQKEREAGHTIYPSESAVFHAFLKTPYERVKVVVVGQDPYHGAGQAHGLSFSVPKGVAVPPSLKNIYKEIALDLNLPIPSHGCLETWAKQGVLMLNATLTVRAGCPRSHHGKGWERFTNAVIAKLCARTDPLVFLLWGKSAKEKCDHVLAQHKHPHAVLSCAHPSPYSAAGFFGCRHFSKANAYLESWGKSPINWRID